jgi:hypothetical protein
MPRSIQGFKPKALSQDHRFYSDDDIEAIIAAAGGTVRGRVARLRQRQALSERLEVVAHNYTQCCQFQTEPTAKQIADAMSDIEAAAAKLIAALHVPEAMDEDPIAPMPAALRSGALQAQAALEAGHGPPKRSGAGLLRDSVHGVYRLHRWAETAKRRWAETYKRDSNQPDRPHAQSDGDVYWSEPRLEPARSTPRAKRHVGNEELDRLFRGLAGIWTGLFKRRIATSVGNLAHPGEVGGPMVRFFSACLTPILKDKTPTSKAIRGRILRLFP